MSDSLVFCYHGTSKSNAKSILKHGLEPYSYLATHLEDALYFGGPYIFEIVFKASDLEVQCHCLNECNLIHQNWQFRVKDGVPKDRIARHYYLKRDKVFKDKKLCEEVTKSNDI